MNDCDLCKKENKGTNWFYITMCDTCQIPLLVSTEHKPEFTEQEKKDIKKLFPNKKIRWKMRKIKNHAHAHIKK